MLRLLCGLPPGLVLLVVLVLPHPAVASDKSCPGTDVRTAATGPAGKNRDISQCICNIEDAMLPTFKSKKSEGCVNILTLDELANDRIQPAIDKFITDTKMPPSQEQKNVWKEHFKRNNDNFVAGVPKGKNCMFIVSTHSKWTKGKKVKIYVLMEELAHMGQAGKETTDPTKQPTRVTKALAQAYAEVRAKYPQIAKVAEDLNSAPTNEEKKELADVLELLMADYSSHIKSLCENLATPEGQALANGTPLQQKNHKDWNCCKVAGATQFDNVVEWRKAKVSKQPPDPAWGGIKQSKLRKFKLDAAK